MNVQREAGDTGHGTPPPEIDWLRKMLRQDRHALILYQLLGTRFCSDNTLVIAMLAKAQEQLSAARKRS